MIRRLPSCLILIITCSLLAGCGQHDRNRWPPTAGDESQAETPASSNSATEVANNQAADAQQSTDTPSATEREIDGDLSVQIDLDESSDNPTIDLSQSFNVVVTNRSDRPLRLWSPVTQSGYYQLSFTFVNARTGKTYVARKRTIDDEPFWVGLSRDDDPNAEVVTIAPQDNFKFQVNFSWFASGDREWEGLPGPVSSSHFSVTAQIESQDDLEGKNRKVWNGRAVSNPVIVRLVDPEIKTPLDCLWKDYVEAAIELMEANPESINSRGDNKNTPLHKAASLGRVDAVRWLLDHGADVNAISYNGFTPLHLTDNPDVVRSILQKRPDLTIVNQGGQTPLQHAAVRLVHARAREEQLKWREIVKLYEDAGAEIDILTAIHQNRLERVKTILKQSPKLADDFQGQSPLRTAASLGRLEICRYLIENYRVDVDDFERGVGYPIIKGALAHPEVVRLLIERGADLKTRITWQGGRTGVWIIGDDATVLHHAANAGVPETIRLLIDNGVDIFATAHDHHDRKQTALEVAAIFGKGDNVSAIVNHPKFDAAELAVRQALVDECLVLGADPTWPASDTEGVKLVRVLLEKGANPNASNHGVTAVQVAANAIRPTQNKENAEIKQIVDVLTAHGATMDLVSAVALGNTDEVQRLLENDPKLANSRRSDGHPALHVAVELNEKAAVNALLKAGVDVDIRSKCKSNVNVDDTALHCAALWGREEIAALLIDSGANVNALTDRMSTPLHDAAGMGHVKLAKLLLEHGANPDARDATGKTPLDWCRGSRANDPTAMEDVFRKYRTQQEE